MYSQPPSRRATVSLLLPIQSAHFKKWNPQASTNTISPLQNAQPSPFCRFNEHPSRRTTVTLLQVQSDPIKTCNSHSSTRTISSLQGMQPLSFYKWNQTLRSVQPSPFYKYNQSPSRRVTVTIIQVKSAPFKTCNRTILQVQSAQIVQFARSNSKTTGYTVSSSSPDLWPNVKFQFNILYKQNCLLDSFKLQFQPYIFY